MQVTASFRRRSLGEDKVWPSGGMLVKRRDELRASGNRADPRIRPTRLKVKCASRARPSLSICINCEHANVLKG